MDHLLASAPIQYGFAGLCIILLGILVWLIQQLIRTIEGCNAVIGRNTEAMREISSTTREVRKVAEATRDELAHLNTTIVARPCIARRQP